MNGREIRLKRVTARVSGRLLCQRASLDRGRLSDIERGYVEPSPDELRRLAKALNQLVEARQQVAQFAGQCGWPGDIG
jgi:transcriptional regulator with XRE-family HTH domain